MHRRQSVSPDISKSAPFQPSHPNDKIRTAARKNGNGLLSIGTGKSGEETSHKGGGGWVAKYPSTLKQPQHMEMLHRENNNNNNNKKEKKNDKVREKMGKMMGSRIDLDRWFFFSSRLVQDIFRSLLDIPLGTFSRPWF